MPELGQLRAFVAVAEDGSFTRAAQRLHLAQQAVSKSVASLEAQLGVTLLVRGTRAVSPTPAGRALLASGVEALARLDAAFAEATAVGQAQAGTVTVGVTPAVGPLSHPAIATALTAEAPRLRVVFQQLRPPAAWELLGRGELDLVVSRAAPADDAHAHAELAPSPAIAIVTPEHRLAGRASVPVAELEGETLQTWEPAGEAYTDALVSRLAAAGAHVQVSVAAVVGSTGSPTLAADEFALRPAGWPLGDAVALELTDPGLQLPLWVHWPLGSPSPAADRLRRHLG